MRNVFRLLAIGLMFCGSRAAAETAPRPHVVFFLIDDLGYADCGFNGGTDIRTPEIDRLAQAGAVLEAHYVQPVCSPTRAALLTGRYATRTGVYTVVRPHAKWGLPLGERTLAQALQEAGYTTAITGKWHLGEFDPAYVPTARGFQRQYGHYFGALDYFTHIRDDVHDWYRDGRELREEGYTTELIAAEARRLIDVQDPKKPLFLYVPFNGVHTPMQVPDRYLEPYASLTGPKKQLAGMLAAVDEAIGGIVEALESKGIKDNTLILFSSDNGGPRPGDNTPLRGFKGSLLEGGVRAAAFAHWPGRIPGGVRIKEPMHVIDWYPTLIQLAGGSLKQETPIDGRDVWPMLTREAPTPHEAILCVQSPDRAAVRIGDWKLLMAPPEAPSNAAPANETPNRRRNRNANRNRPGNGQAPVYQLFNLAADIGEADDRAQQEPDRLATMKETLHALLKDAVPSGQTP